MVEKKNYVKPAVQSEEALEQTSLQCNVSYLPMEETCEWGANLAPGAGCEGDVSKGAVFTGVFCAEQVNAEYGCLVLLS